MVELIRTDDIVLVALLEMRLADLGIKAVVFDAHTAGAYGFALPGVQRRVMVDEDHLVRARRVLEEATNPDRTA